MQTILAAGTVRAKTLTRQTGDEICGRDLAHDHVFVRLAKVGAIPIRTAVKVKVEEAGFFDFVGQDASFSQNLVQPTGSGARRPDHKKGGERPLTFQRHRVFYAPVI